MFKRRLREDWFTVGAGIALAVCEVMNDVWHVEVSGKICTMTLDELDQAFQANRIHEGTYVRHEGAKQWAKLGDVAGLDAPGASVADIVVDVAAVKARPRARGLVVGIAVAMMAFGGLGLAAPGPSRAYAFGAMAAVTRAVETPAVVLAAVAPPVAAPPVVVATPVVVVAPAIVRPLPSAENTHARIDKVRSGQKKNRTASPARRPAKPVPIGLPEFHEGGNDHDPLNASL